MLSQQFIAVLHKILSQDRITISPFRTVAQFKLYIVKVFTHGF